MYPYLQIYKSTFWRDFFVKVPNILDTARLEVVQNYIRNFAEKSIIKHFKTNGTKCCNNSVKSLLIIERYKRAFNIDAFL